MTDAFKPGTFYRGTRTGVPYALYSRPSTTRRAGDDSPNGYLGGVSVEALMVLNVGKQFNDTCWWIQILHDCKVGWIIADPRFYSDDIHSNV